MFVALFQFVLSGISIFFQIRPVYILVKYVHDHDEHMKKVSVAKPCGLFD